MSDLVNPDSIESLVGAKRHPVQHLARAVSAQQRVYVLHSVQCKGIHDDLRECPYSKALDLGIDPDDWRGYEDQPVVVAIIHDRLFPINPLQRGMARPRVPRIRRHAQLLPGGEAMTRKPLPDLWWPGQVHVAGDHTTCAKHCAARPRAGVMSNDYNPPILEDEDGAPYPEGVQAIARERGRQITEEGYTAEHDEHHAVGQFVSTAILYLGGKHAGHAPWPVKRADPGDSPGYYQRRDLVKAGALIAAAIDRLDAARDGATHDREQES